MKILNMKLKAFGPFRREVNIDFTRFQTAGTSGLYTISGETGSGKTTLFDAISFGLFGKLTGQFKNEAEVRSQYASDSEETFVELVFSQNGKMYKVYRNPGFVKEGNKTKSGESIILYRMENEEESVIASKAKTVNSKIEEIIGFNIEQFRQIVVLPQGEFLKVLNSDTKTKEELISSILDLSVYDSIMEEVKTRFSSISNRLQNVKSKQEQLLSTHSVNTIDELKSLEYETKIKLDEAKLSLDNLNRTLNELSGEAKEYKENNNLLVEIDSLEKSLIEEHGIDEEISNDKLRKGRLEVVRELEGLYREEKRLERELETVSSNLNEALENKKASSINIKEIPSLEKEMESLDKSLTKAKFDRKEKAELLQIEKAINDDSVKLSALEKELNDSKNKVSLYEKEIKDFDENIRNNKNSISELDKIINSFDQKENDEIADLLNKRNNKRQIEASIDKISSSLRSDSEKLEELKKESLIKKNDYLKAELSFNKMELSKFSHMVIENEPCPLCGSLTHPSILHVNEDCITKNKVDSLKAEYECLSSKVASLSAIIDQKMKQIEDEKKKEAYLLKEEIFDELDSRLDSLNKKKKDIENAKIERSKTTREMELCERKREEAMSSISKIKIEDISERCISLKSKIESSVTRMDELRKQIDEDALKKDLDILIFSLEQDIKNIQLKIQKYKSDDAKYSESVEQIKTRLSTIETSLKDSKEKLGKSLEERLLTLEELDNDIQNIGEIAKLDEKIKFHETKIETLSAKLETAKKLLKYQEVKDLDEINGRIENVKSEIGENDTKYREISQLYGSISINVNEYEKLALSIKDDLKEYELYSMLDSIVNGKYNGKRKITLKRYVIMQFLDKILIHANKYLEAFTENRYKLIRKEADINSSDKGLNLIVYDINTSKTRDVSNISGGESFMASLALSLGMSEYISSIKGGIKVENIFIDEGFGTLDDKTLDQAIETLMTLASSGSRSVGMISHVEKLQERINSGIIVKKSNTGSIIEYV